MKKLPNPKSRNTRKNRKPTKQRKPSNAIFYAGSALFVFMATRIILAQDDYFQSQPPIISYGVALVMAVIAFFAEYLRNLRHRKLEEKSDKKVDPNAGEPKKFWHF